MLEVIAGFVLAVTFLLGLAGAVLGWLAWKEAKKCRPALAKALRVTADLVDEMARFARVDPSMTGSEGLRAMAHETEADLPAVSRPRMPEGPKPSRMRPLTDEEEWAMEQSRRDFAGLSDADAVKARRWVRGVQEERMALSEG